MIHESLKLDERHVEQIEGKDFRPISTQLFAVVENKRDYSLALANCQLPLGDARIFRLFLVLLPDFTGPSARRYSAKTLYVLAESARDAISQASCDLAESCPYEDQIAWEKVAAVVQVPYRIRGWSANSF